MLSTDQVAIAPCTHCVQAQRPTFEGKTAGGLLQAYSAEEREVWRIPKW